MKTPVKLAIGISVPVAIIAGGLLLLLLKPNCDSCSMMCGVSCKGKRKCKGTKCDDPAARCTDGVCVVKHSCSATGECVPDPDGAFHGKTCTCFGLREGECSLVGDTGDYTLRDCVARDSDFQCAPGTGTCERALGATTGWKTAADCKCFECEAMTCVPSANPAGGIDGVTCGQCGLWGCDAGECVQKETGGAWEQSAQCRCGLCRDGACAPTDAGGAYASVSACQADGAAICKDPGLGWGCNSLAGNEETCAQVLGGGSPSLEECSCWTCAGEPPGPLSACTFDAAGGGSYDSFQDCFEDGTEKCGWKYMCQSQPAE